MPRNKLLLPCLMLLVTFIAINACSSQKSYLNYDESAAAGTRTNLIQVSQIQELNSNNTVYFDLDQYAIRSEFYQMLDAHANFLNSYFPDKKVTIEGHADERGTPEYNIALGEQRAKTVQMYLQGKGVSADQIVILSYGKEKPALLGHDKLTYAKNRRAILIY